MKFHYQNSSIMYVNMYRKVAKGRPGHTVYGTPIAVMGYQCWTEGRSSTAVAEDLTPTATASVAEV